MKKANWYIALQIYKPECDKKTLFSPVMGYTENFMYDGTKIVLGFRKTNSRSWVCDEVSTGYSINKYDKTRKALLSQIKP